MMAAPSTLANCKRIASMRLAAWVLFSVAWRGQACGQAPCNVTTFDEGAAGPELPCTLLVDGSISESNQTRYVQATQEVVVTPGANGTHVMPQVKLEVRPADLGLNVLDTTAVFGQYDLVEVSIPFPAALDTLFRNHFMARYIHEWSSVWGAGDPAAYSYCDTCTLNPFDPEEVDVWIISERWQDGAWVDRKRTNGFYYVDFQRTLEASPPYMEHDSLGKFNWTPLPNELQFIDQLREFRGRMAFAETGTYRLTAMSWADGFHQSEPILVEVVASASKGYVQVDSAHPQYLMFGNKELHFPCGPNLQANARRSKVPLAEPNETESVLVAYDADCNAITAIDSLNWCKRKETEWAVNEYGHTPIHQAFFLALHDELDQLQQAGVKSCRIMAQPWSFELEYQTLGDYSPSMHRAWELDELLRKARETDVVIQWNLQGQSPFNYNYFNHRYASWGDGESGTTKDSYCYRDELLLEHPIEFFSSDSAQTWYRKKLRYFFARYGWSPNIGVIELFSEISGTEFQTDSTALVRPYEQDTIPQHTAYVNAIENWQISTLAYLRDTLHVNNHPLAVSYLHNGVDPVDASPEFADVYCQSCYTTDYTDIAGINNEPINQQSLTRPAYCSELGFGTAIRSEMGKLNVQLLQSKATAARRAGAGFDWYSTMGVDEGLLTTQGMLTNYKDSIKINFSDWYCLSVDSIQSESFSSLGTDLIVEHKCNHYFMGYEYCAGIIFNSSFGHVQALRYFDSEMIDSLNCALQTDYNVTDIEYTHIQVSLSQDIRDQLMPGSYMFDPVSGQSWEIDSTNTNGMNLDSCFLTTGSQHLLFLLKIDLLKSTPASQLNNPVSNFGSESIEIAAVPIEERPQNKKVTFYPNPASNEICFKGDTESGSIISSCLLYDRNGRLVGIWKSLESCLPTDHLEPGMYFLICSDGSIQKIAIE